MEAALIFACLSQMVEFVNALLVVLVVFKIVQLMSDYDCKYETSEIDLVYSYQNFFSLF